jgi:hypothetical protein
VKSFVDSVLAVDPDANVAVVGDINDFQFSAPMEILKASMHALIETLPESERYTYVFEGNSQALDHILVSPGMYTKLDGYDVVHVNAEFADQASDHDPQVARFEFNNAPTVKTPNISPEPSIKDETATASATFSDADPDNDPFTCTVDYGDGTGAVDGTITGSTCTGPAHVYANVGSYTVTVIVTDEFGSSGSASTSHSVVYNFVGFFQPIDSLPAFNRAQAGQGIPVKFSLSGAQGLAIFENDYPVSQQIGCESSSVGGEVEETVTAGASSLSYDPATDTYTYVWKTNKSWAGTCRQLLVTLDDGTVHVANFNFTK